MIRTIKLTVCAAVLAALTTTAHANLVVQGTPITDPLSFSGEFLFNPGVGGGNTYTTPAGGNWLVNVIVEGDHAEAFVWHMVGPHGVSESTVGLIQVLSAVLTGSTSFETRTTPHASIPGHNDVGKLVV